MASAITWRSIAAPDATGAAQILQQADQNIGRGVDAFKNIADNQVATITDQNVSALAQQIMGVDKGVDGFDQLDQVQSQLQGVNAADIGGTKGLESLMNMAKGKRTELETEAVGSFNEMLAQARSTGDFSGITTAKRDIASKLSNAAPLLEAARSAEAGYNANKIMNDIAQGKDVTSYLNDKTIDFSQPEMNQVLQTIAQKADDKIVGSFLMETPSLIKSAVSEGNIAGIQEEVNRLFGSNPEKYAKNYKVIQGVMDQANNAIIKSKELRPNEQALVEIAESTLNFQREQFEDQLAANRASLTQEAKQKVAALEAAEGLTVLGAVQKSLGDSVLDKSFPIFGDTNQQNALEKIQKVLLKRPDISPAAIIYATQAYPELAESFWANEDTFLNTAIKAQEDLNANKADWDKLRNEEIVAKQKFNDYYIANKVKIAEQTSGMVTARNQNNPYPQFEVPPSYQAWLNEIEGKKTTDDAKAIVTTGKTESKSTPPVNEDVPLKSTDKPKAFNYLNTFDAAFNAVLNRTSKGSAVDVYEAVNKLREEGVDETSAIGQITGGLGAPAGAAVGGLFKLGLDVKEVASLLLMSKKERDSYFKNKESENK